MFVLENIKYKNILDISELVIPQGKVTCLVGESGSGKTTLLKHLNKMISPDEGKINYRDKDIGSFNPVDLRREVIMLPQNPVIFPGSIRENLLTGLNFAEKSIPGDEELYDVLKSLKLNKGLEEDAAVLSGGEKQRLAICRIMLMLPEVLLLDEPTSALDDETEEIAIKEVISKVRMNGKTVVLVTHSAEIAERFGEIIIKIRDGQVVNRKEAKLNHE